MFEVRVVFPTAWDRKQLLVRRELWAADCAVTFEPPDDADCPDDFDLLGMIDGALAGWRGSVGGVFSSSDYPGAAAAAAIGTGLGLHSSRPEAIMTAAHKGLSRRAQQELAPEATPRFQVLDPDRLGSEPVAFGYPCFVKPAKGCYSVLARRVEDEAQLRAFLGSEAVADYRHRYLRVYHALVSRYLGRGVDGAAFVAEEAISGRLASVEGYVTGEKAHALGVVDSARASGGSFVAFEYPSALPERVQARMEALACRLAEGLGLRWTMFNVEFMWDPERDLVRTVEINPRMCGQFADLYEKVDGVHGYRVALDLACGREPDPRRRAGAFACAASYPMRVFEPVRVLRAPDPEDLTAAAALDPGTLVWNEVRAGEELSDFASADDGHSYRYAVINVGARTRQGLAARRDATLERLGYRFERLAAGSC